jgi:predicted acylesterase/phospholipase RssA
MRYLLYVASPHQIEKIRKDPQFLAIAQPKKESFFIQHQALRGMGLHLSFVDHLDRVSIHLRRYPVDILIYDERSQGVEAVRALGQIKEEIETLSQLWGADFHFPMGRTIAILENSNLASHRAFLLGRDHIRDVILNPPDLGRVFRWVGKILINQIKRQATQPNQVGVALSGGGLEGFLYQVGVLYALEKALEKGSLYGAHVFSGVSSGSICAAMLAGQIPVEEVVRSIYGTSKKIPNITARGLYDLALGHIGKKLISPNNILFSLDPIKWIQKFVQSIPTGFFKGDRLREFIEQSLEAFQVPDSIGELKSKLLIGATHQDTFEHAILGDPPWTDLKISEAVRASCALPPFFTPSLIKGEPFIDGQITRSTNLEAVVKKGCELIFIIDPMKPFSTLEPGFVEKEGGIFTLIQSIKTLIHSRFRGALEQATERYPQVDFLVFQPSGPCAQAMAGSPMKLKLHTPILELAYRGTLKRLRERHQVYEAKLAKYGFSLASPKKLLDLEERFTF